MMSNNKKVLFIATNNLFLRTGGGLATLAFFEAVRKIFQEDVDIILPKESICNNISEKTAVFRVPSRKKILAIIGLLFGRLHRYKNYVIKHLKKFRNIYKLCIINGGMYAGDMIDIIKFYNIKVIVIHHNFDREYHIDNKSIASFYGIFSYYIIRNERNAYKKADLNLFLTEADKRAFEKYYGVSNGLNNIIGVFEYLSLFVPLAKEVTLPYKLIITGSMDHNQTEYGIRNFYEVCYPIIKEYFSDIKIIISGRNPTDLILSIAEREKERIVVIANPENMEDVINLGAIYCCPTNIGGGLKLRIMDGLRQGLPIITHRISSRGYDGFFDKPYFRIYDDRETFRNGLEKLLDLYKTGKVDHKQIQNDYNDYFNFAAGTKRLEKIIMNWVKK
jgi:hypothetical protein